MDDDPIRWLYGLERFGIKLGLDTMRRVLAQIDRPDLAAPAILIAGTNGKGSVAAYLDSIFEAAGLRVGLYTSPHLVRLNERIRIAGRDIDTPSLSAHLQRLRGLLERAVAEGSLPSLPSFFEVVTACALLAFREARVDIEVLEVGLGGRLDATNVVPARVSVVVSIDLDHTDRLGTTLEQIAFEKAGIIKPGRALVSGVARPEAVAVLRAECERHGARFVDARRRARIGDPDLRPGLAGRHQLANAQVAIVAAEELARELALPLTAVTAEAVREGLARVRWPGRLQWIEGSPSILLDGAHNPAGAETLAIWLRDRGGAAPVLLFGAMSGKDVPGILAPLAGLVTHAILTRPSVERAAEPGDLLDAARVLGVACEVVSDPLEALSRAREQARDAYVLVAGSLYLVGEILAWIEGTAAEPISM